MATGDEQEGHGFDKKSNQDYMRRAVTVFLQEVLGEQPAAGSDR